MKRNSRRLSRWIVLTVIALSVGMIGASEQFPPEGPLAFLSAQIHALFIEAGLLAAESADQQPQSEPRLVTALALPSQICTPQRAAELASFAPSEQRVRTPDRAKRGSAFVASSNLVSCST